jgi:transcriptional regulator with XRE-family HTH domain
LASNVTIEQIKAARALLRWSQTDLARASGISEESVKRLEADISSLGGRSSTIEKLVAAFEKSGVIFDEAGQRGSPNVYLQERRWR